MRALAESVALASLVPEALANPDQGPVAFHPMEANLDRDTAAILDQDTAVAAVPGRDDPEAVVILDRDVAAPKSAAKLPAAERLAEQLSREVAASLDQVGQEVLANLDRVCLEASANLDRGNQEVLASRDRDVRQEELERQELRYNTRFLHVRVP